MRLRHEPGLEDPADGDLLWTGTYTLSAEVRWGMLIG